MNRTRAARDGEQMERPHARTKMTFSIVQASIRYRNCQIYQYHDKKLAALKNTNGLVAARLRIPHVGGRMLVGQLVKDGEIYLP